MDDQIKILNSMGLLVMERMPDGSFRQIGNAPGWLGLFLRKGSELRPDKMSPFLENFLIDAENFWRSAISGKLRSDPWMETDPVSGEEHAFEAIAVVSDSRKILLIEKVSCSYYKEKQDIIQKGRELSLAYHRLEKIEAELRKAKNEAEAANRAKSEFLSNMGHELRTPMNAVIGFIYLVLQSNLGSSQTEYLNHAYESAQSLMKILNDILAYSELESKDHQSEEAEFVINNVLKRLSDKITPEAEAKGLMIRYSVSEGIPRILSGDSEKLNQILVNLADNAIKFTDKGCVSVRIEAVSRSESRIKLRFSIADTGIGIPQDKLPIIFDAFTQADSSSTRRFGGTGLGLAICRRLSEMMGGKIGVESEKGRGSTFTLTATFGVTSPDDLEAVSNHSLKIAQKDESQHIGCSEFCDTSHAITSLKKLRTLIHEGDFESVACMKQIRKDLTGISAKDKIARLESYIHNYEFEAAEEILNEILNTIKEN